MSEQGERRITRRLRTFYVFRLLATSYLYGAIFMMFQASRGLSFFESLALGGVFSAVVVLVEVPTGVFADQVGRRRSMLAGSLAMVVSCLVAVQAHSFATFAIAEALAALSIALCSGADSAYLYDFLRAHGREHEYGEREATASAAHLLGSALAFAGGGLLASVDLTLPYYVTAGVAALTAVIAGFLADDRPMLAARAVHRRTLRSWGGEVTSALADVGKSSRLLWLVGYSAVVFVLLRATIYLYQPYLEERGLGTVGKGLMFAGVSVVAAFAAYRTYALRRRVGDEMLQWTLLAALAISFVGLAGVGSGPWMLALLVVQAVANGMYSPLTKPLLNREIVDSGRRAAILSVESMVRRAAMGLFAMLAGIFGSNDVMLLCGGVGLAGLVLLAIARVRVGMREVRPDARVAISIHTDGTGGT
ncbi:MAG: MFS transporter [Kofleriaceae bacterium]|nr:MFS transporter [Kofleriaceae bacterium]